MDQSRSIQDRFDPAAAAYAVSAVHRAGEDLDAMLAAGVRSGAERVLDLGCGAGHTALAFAARTKEVVAFDLTEAMLRQAAALADERGLANLRFEQGDVSRLPFADGEFDVVTSRLSAHHYADPRAALCEAFRVLAPDGLFLLSDTVAPEDPASDSFLNGFEMLRDASHVRDHRISEWRAMFQEAGFAPALLGTFEIAQAFDPWVARIGTPEGAVTGLRSLFDTAPDDVRRRFGIEGHGSYDFTLTLAVLKGTPNDSPDRP